MVNVVYARTLNGCIDYLWLAKAIIGGLGASQRHITRVVVLRADGKTDQDIPGLDITYKELCRICGRGRPRQDNVSLWHLAHFLGDYFDLPNAKAPIPRKLVKFANIMVKESVMASEKAVRLPASGFTWAEVAQTVRQHLWAGHEVRVISVDGGFEVVLGERFVSQSGIGEETNPVFAEYRIAGFLYYCFYGAEKRVPGVSNG